MTPEQRRLVSSLGGKALKPQQRSFSQNRELAREAGRKGGLRPKTRKPLTPQEVERRQAFATDGRGRRPIKKKLRFEVFKRDGFSCTYCGRKPPEVTLEVDHVVAVIDGGVTALENLTTSCFTCNRGKSYRGLNVVSESVANIVPRETPKSVANIPGGSNGQDVSR